MNRILQSIKKYYNYLVEAEIRVDNPAQYIQIKDNKNKHRLGGKRLLNKEDLQALWQHLIETKPRQAQMKRRNLGLLSLVFFQALRTGEIKAINVEDINLAKGELYIKESSKNRARTLVLDKKQLLLLYEYIYQDRPNLVENNPKEKALFITRKGGREQGETVHTLIKKLRNYYPNININPNLIRMSVIAQKFKEGNSLQVVQYFAGHRYPSSTERYKSSDIEALKAGILKHHPLG